MSLQPVVNQGKRILCLVPEFTPIDLQSKGLGQQDSQLLPCYNL